jgi:hypothetical protein
VDNTPILKRASYPIRISSIITSLAIHVAFICCLVLISSDTEKAKKVASSDLSRFEVHKLLIYEVRTRLQDVAPPTPDVFPKPQGEELSKQAIVAKSSQAKSAEQFIWQPAPKLQIKQDLRTPNLIATMASSLPPPPAPPKENLPPLKDVAGVKAIQQNDSPKQPGGDLDHAPDNRVKVAEPQKQLKSFVPPVTRQPQLPLPVPVSVAEAPVLSNSSMAMNSLLPAGAGIPALARSAAPALTAPIAPAANPGSARVDIAIASLHPSDENRELPEGERPGRFSKAAIKGAPSTGDPSGVPTLIVPNLAIREDKTGLAKVPGEKGAQKTILYTERVRGVSASTLSVPLRPSSRSIPKLVDARFQGRNVYAMVIPIENLPGYAGDWIVWFAEKEPKAGETPLMRSPLPFRKLEPADQPASGTSGGQQIQITGTLQKDGKLDGITASAKLGLAVEQAAIRDITAWEFTPATRNGLPVAVDVVIEISFVYPQALAKSSQP